MNKTNLTKNFLDQFLTAKDEIDINNNKNQINMNNINDYLSNRTASTQNTAFQSGNLTNTNKCNDKNKNGNKIIQLNSCSNSNNYEYVEHQNKLAGINNLVSLSSTNLEDNPLNDNINNNNNYNENILLTRKLEKNEGIITKRKNNSMISFSPKIVSGKQIMHLNNLNTVKSNNTIKATSQQKLNKYLSKNNYKQCLNATKITNTNTIINSNSNNINKIQKISYKSNNNKFNKDKTGKLKERSLTSPFKNGNNDTNNKSKSIIKSIKISSNKSDKTLNNSLTKKSDLYLKSTKSKNTFKSTNLLSNRYFGSSNLLNNNNNNNFTQSNDNSQNITLKLETTPKHNISKTIDTNNDLLSLVSSHIINSPDKDSFTQNSKNNSNSNSNTNLNYLTLNLKKAEKFLI